APLPPLAAAVPFEPATAPLPAAAAFVPISPPLAAGPPAAAPAAARVPSHSVFTPGKMSLHPIPNAVESMPQTLVAVTQQDLPSAIITAGQWGASGSGGVQTPDTT